MLYIKLNPSQLSNIFFFYQIQSLVISGGNFQANVEDFENPNAGEVVSLLLGDEEVEENGKTIFRIDEITIHDTF